jgi:hypothetical protein
MILTLIICQMRGIQNIGVDLLGKLLAFCLISSIELVIFFSSCLITNKSFIFRLNGFVALFLPTEIAFLYIAGLFKGEGIGIQWAIFVGIIIVLYLICVILDKTIFRKQGQEYTVQLDRYKEERRDESAS